MENLKLIGLVENKAKEIILKYFRDKEPPYDPLVVVERENISLVKLSEFVENNNLNFERLYKTMGRSIDLVPEFREYHYAHSNLHELSIIDGVLTDDLMIIFDIGIEYYLASIDVDGVFFINGNYPSILINDYKGYPKPIINHILAHKLKHYFFAEHVSTPKKSYSAFNVKEYLANYFASCFLMPQDIFISFAKQYNFDTEKLAQKFQVSQESALIRLHALKNHHNL